jgi:hypothetical protein
MAETAFEELARLRREVSELTGPQQISPMIAGASRVTEATRTALAGVGRRTEVVTAPTRRHPLLALAIALGVGWALGTAWRYARPISSVMQWRRRQAN